MFLGYCSENPYEEGKAEGIRWYIPNDEIDVIWEVKRKIGRLIVSCNDEVVVNITYSDEPWFNSCQQKYRNAIGRISFRAECGGAFNDEASKKYRISPVSPDMETGELFLYKVIEYVYL